MNYDVLIIGSGASGLSAALALAPHHRVCVLAKGELDSGSTSWAQGGIAAVIDTSDTFENHIADTMVAGAGLNRLETVEFVIENAPQMIDDLIDLGVPFNKSSGDTLHLTREGGHSHRRIAHVDDATGWAVQEALIRAARKHPNIDMLSNMSAIDLIADKHLIKPKGDTRIWGCYALNGRIGKVETISARATIMATGGAGRTYLFSTSPRGATGDGIAMAWRAGARISNMEMMQFHPTCLYNLEVKNFLITEAVRGEGGFLTIPGTGDRFMSTFDERAELAPRDIVARAIDHEIKRLGLDYVHLNIAHRGHDFVKGHFPNILNKLTSLGMDITEEPIPVVPAQHYTCGGILVNLNGQSDLPGLYAIGEVSQSGLHGANRLASNSLLECFVFGNASAKHIIEHWGDNPPPPAICDWDESQVTDSDEEVIIKQNWTEIRRFMWNYVGIVRSVKRLERARNRIALLREEVAEYYNHFRVTKDLIELRNLLEVGDLIVQSSLARKESRGLHYVIDYPGLLPEAKDTILTPHNYHRL